MKLEEQVCSLEIARRLRELGVKQESLFGWAGYGEPRKCQNCGKECGHGTGFDLYPTDPFDQNIMNVRGLKLGTWYAAFTVAELLDMAPASTSMLKRTDLPTKKVARYYVETFEHYRDSDWNENPANALARMLIYLIENNLVSV